MLLGRQTYGDRSAVPANAPEEVGGKPLNEATKYVCSPSCPSLDWSQGVLIDLPRSFESVCPVPEEEGAITPAQVIYLEGRAAHRCACADGSDLPARGTWFLDTPTATEPQPWPNANNSA